MQIEKFRALTDHGYMVRVSKQEALALIASLSQQLLNGEVTPGRTAFYTDPPEVEYFSIAVREPGIAFEKVEVKK